MDFSGIVTFSKVKKWFEDNKDKFEKLGDDNIGCKLEINRPFWFKNHAECDKIESVVFTGNSNEEIFMKMYEKCLKTLVWKGGRNDGKSVDLLDYLQPYNKVFEDMIYKLGDEYAVRPEYTVDSDDEKEYDIEEYSEHSVEECDVEECDEEEDAKEEDNSEKEFNDYGDIIIKDSNKEKYELLLIRGLVKDKIDFYWGVGDCCFSVTELEAV